MALLSRSVRFAIAVLLAVVAGCLVVQNSRIRPLSLDLPTQVHSPVKVHLLDGSVVVFPDGMVVSRDSITGLGNRYSPLREVQGPVRSISLDSVLGAETAERNTDPAGTVALSLLATVGGTALTVVLFGSCPTIYSDSAGVPVLEAESFSYSIAPLLEKRDVDRLRAQPDAEGVLRLEVRNEALETHYIDHLEVIEVSHRPGEEVFPEAYGLPVAVTGLAPAASVRDRAGRELNEILAHADDHAFATAETTLASASHADAEDWIEVVVPRPQGRDSLALALRMRSSLLTTLILYDYMLARPGARSLDWVGRDLGRITTLARLGRWYVERLGLRIAVWDGRAYRQVGRLVDFGPTAWRNVAVVVPALGEDSVRIRLSFTADQWRIDRLAVSPEVRRLSPRTIRLTRFTTPTGQERPDLRAVLTDPDGRRLVTVPGERFFAEFDVGVDPKSTRTFFLAAQGYYTEWIRGAWMRDPAEATAFDPSSADLGEMLSTWRTTRDSLETHFFRLRVPVL